MVKCGEPGCSLELTNGRERRRHVHSEHRLLPDICHQCNDEPFLFATALQQHINDGHMKLNRIPRPRRRKKKNPISVLSTPSFKPMDNLSASFNLLSTGSTSYPRPAGLTSSASSSNTAPICTDLFHTRSSVDLNKFIADKIQPDSNFLTSCGKAVDEVVNFLQHNVSQMVRPTKVIKGGSLCKGTAVIGKSDVDLVVMIDGYADVHGLKKDMKKVLDSLEKSMNSYPNTTVTGTTDRAVQVKIRKMGYTIEADVLPAIDLSVESTASRHRVFEKMKHESWETQRSYSACLAPLQKTLFEGIPTQLKSLIRLVKYWKKEKLQGAEKCRTKWPASYALELITLDRWTKAGEPNSFDMTRALHSVITSLKNHTSYRITLPKRMFYGKDLLNLDEDKPYIMDPCNPFNNLYVIGGYDWRTCAVKAAEWLSNPLFNGCDSGTVHWW